LLRSLQPTDANEVFALRSDDNVNKYIERKKATSIEDAYRFIEMIAKNVSNNETLLWAIELKQTHAFAGTVLLWNINKEKDEIELGYELLPHIMEKELCRKQ
jgi:ribosomal-protein-alanine N-acetyltransferase